MAGAQSTPGGIEELVHTLANDNQLEYWLGAIGEGRVSEEAEASLMDMAWEQVIKDHGLIPEYAALHGLRERVLETAETRWAFREAARVQA
jgi:hypothetical protein